MKRMRAAWICLSLWVQAVLAPAALARTDELPPAAAQALAAAGVPADALTGLALPLHGSIWPWQRWERNADRAVQPGSTIKLLTSAVALDRLGPNFRGRTDVLATGPVLGEVLNGDLVLKGGADADLNTAQLWQLLQDLRDQGIRQINGDVVLDRSLFQPTRLDLGLPPFDDNPKAPYNVIPDALNLNGSLLEVAISADGQSAAARSLPRLDGVALQADLTLDDRPCAAWRDGWQAPEVHNSGAALTVHLKGRFPRNCSVRTALQLPERNRLAEALLRTLWAQMGGQISGVVREGQASADARVLAWRQARPWGELLRPLNKQSDNALSRLLYLQLGAAARPEQPMLTTLQSAEHQVRQWLAHQGIADDGLVLDNGSGLSRRERISARQLVQVLERALAGPYAADLLMSLPTVGVDGTMRNRLTRSPATGWTRLKTGTLHNVTALAGVVQDHRQHAWVLVAIVNHDNAGRARPALDALVDWLVQGRPGPAPGAPGGGLREP